ncbi:MAG: zinc ABC transporter substrate-binding protein, partial [Sphaerochaetaceae bacterium]|nr:zinc ABC transporter substrate-binding protein [Sphaerochaetaceae bacterium]
MNRKLFKMIKLAFALACVLALAGCSKADDDPRPVVAVSIVPEQAFVDAVAGSLVRTVTLIPPGASPETFEMSVIQREDLALANLYFSIGVQAEDRIMRSVSGSTRVVKLADVCDQAYPSLDLGGRRDPHVWLSPSRAIAMVEAIRDELSALDPENKAVYESNAASYIEQIAQAREQISSELQGVKCRSFIVFHPAFGYFADEFGLEMIALEEDGKEATASHMAEVIDLAREKGSRVIFYQAEADSRQSEAFAEELGIKAVKLEPLAYDYVGNLKAMA